MQDEGKINADALGEKGLDRKSEEIKCALVRDGGMLDR
jgi:hypothetical protein